MKRFCVNCGKETSELIKSLCTDCYLRKYDAFEVPKVLPLDYDFRSNRIKIGHEWVEKSLDSLTDFVKEKVGKLAAKRRIPVKDVKVFLEPKENFVDAVVSFTIGMDGVELRVEKKTRVVLRKTISDASAKLSSDYFEATIQMRFPEQPTPKQQKEKLAEVLTLMKAEKKRNELAEVVDVKKSRKGFDVVVASFKAADKVTRQLAKRYGTRVIYSNSLFGVDDSGKNRYRHTYCLKFQN